MSAHSVQSQQADIGMALSHAREFHAQVSRILEKVPRDLNEANQYLAANPAQTTFIATNLIFACELYLKTVLTLGGHRVPRDHNLWSIYKRIPEKDRQIIEQEFNREFAKIEHAMSMNMLLTTEEGLPPEEVVAALELDRETAPKGEFKSLSRVLKDTGGSYQTWRYLFQSIRASKTRRVVRFHWDHLNCLCRTLDAILVRTYQASEAGASRP